MPDPTDAFETWLLHRVTQAVEAGEVSADLLAELRAELDAVRERPQEEGHAAAVRDIAQKLNISLVRAEHMLTSLEAQPTATRELMMRRIAEAWLEGQRRAYRNSFSPPIALVLVRAGLNYEAR